MNRVPLRNRSILIVEDEPLLAFDYADELEMLGARPQVAFTLDEGLAAVSQSPPEFAILDVNLGTEMSWPIAAALRQRGVPFLLVSGFAMASQLPEDIKPADCLEKPVGAHKIASGLIDLAVAPT